MGVERVSVDGVLCVLRMGVDLDLCAMGKVEVRSGGVEPSLDFRRSEGVVRALWTEDAVTVLIPRRLRA